MMKKAIRISISITIILILPLFHINAINRIEGRLDTDKYEIALEQFAFRYGDTLDLKLIDDRFRIDDKKGRFHSIPFDAISFFHNGHHKDFFIVEIWNEDNDDDNYADGWRWGVIDARGNELIPFAYERIKYVSPCGSHMDFFICNNYGSTQKTLYDVNYDTLFIADFDKIHGFSDRGYAIAEKEDTFYIVDLKGNAKMVKEQTYGIDYFSPYEDYIETYNLDDNDDNPMKYYGAVDYNGEIILPCIYKSDEQGRKHFLQQINKYIRKKKRK